MTALLVVLLLSNAQALDKARSIWGPTAWTKQFGQRAKPVRFQVGCVLNGKRVLVAEAIGSWDEAFNKVNMVMNGLRVLTAVARDAAGNQTETGITTVYVCNP